jgi:hypothetical protein
MVDALKQHNSTVSEKAYKQAIKDLKAQKIQAAENDDLGAVIAIDEQLDELREAKESQKPEETTVYTKEDWEDAFEGFIAKNQWYNTDRKRQVFADAIGVDYVQKNKGASPEEVYQYVIGEVKKEFGTEQAKKPAVAPVAGAGRRAGKQPKKYTLADVPEEDREVAKIVISSGISEEEYLKQYFQQ